MKQEYFSLSNIQILSLLPTLITLSLIFDECHHPEKHCYLLPWCSVFYTLDTVQLLAGYFWDCCKAFLAVCSRGTLNTFCFLFLYWLAIYEHSQNITRSAVLHVSWLCAAGSPYHFHLQQLNQRLLLITLILSQRKRKINAACCCTSISKSDSESSLSSYCMWGQNLKYLSNKIHSTE